MLNIVTGIIVRALKVVIYGVEGVGKSTLASQFPNPLFIDVEGGTSQLNVRRLQRPNTWTELLSMIAEVAKTPEICKTLILDTCDWAEQLCLEHILAKYNQSSIESFGYGKGYQILAEEFGQLITAMNACITAGINVVALAHSKQRKVELPDQTGAYDHYEMKLSRQVSPILKEWADLLLFCNFETILITTENKTKKATGGRRVMYTSHSPVFDAKNRHGLPEVLPLEYRAIAHLFGDGPAPGKPIDELRSLMTRDGITDEQLRKFVSGKGHYPEETAIADYPEGFITCWCLKYWDRIAESITQTESKETKEG